MSQPPVGLVPPPLPPGWTEHRAPAGQLYWFNPTTNISTYVRPLPPPPFFFPPPPPSFQQQPLPPLHFSSSSSAAPATQPPKKDKKEKPKTKLPIPGTDWTKVITNKGNVFWTKKLTKESVWVVPDEIKDIVDQLEKEEKSETASGKKRKERDDEENKDEDEEDEDVESTKVEIESEGEEEKEKEKEPEKEPEEAPKKKKQKKKVIREIEELENDEDWQRQIAEQMAAEVEATQEKEQADVPAAAKEEEKKKPAEAVLPPPPVAPRGGNYATRIEVSSPEEGAALFKAMLAEKDINPMAPWDMELTKFVNDPRYLAVKALRDRRDLFDEYCKLKIRENRAAKKAAQEAGGITKLDPLAAYRQLLLQTVTSTRTHFSDFKKANSKDSRFREFGKTEGEKEKVFKVWLRELGEKKRVEAMKVEGEFLDMLREDGEIRKGDKWNEVKLRHASDPRYSAVNSSSLRESLFTQFLSSSSSTTTTKESANPDTTKLDRWARAAASLKERELQVQKEKEKLEKNSNFAKRVLGKDEGEREFKSLLIDFVKDHDVRWDSVLPLLEKDPRFTTSPLNPYDQRRLFDLHLSEVYSKRIASLESIFLANSPSLNTSFISILPTLSTLPQVNRLVGEDMNKLEALYSTWSQKRVGIAKNEFIELLKESPIIDHWGRLQKDAVGGKEEVLEVKDEEADDDDDAIDLRNMAKQIDLKAIHAVLKHDKRYLVFDHEPEKRNEWIKEFVDNLAAPKLTAHQR